MFRKTTLYPSVILTFVHRTQKSVFGTTNYRTIYVQHVSSLRQVQILGTNVNLPLCLRTCSCTFKKSTLTFGRYQSQTSDKMLANVAYLFEFPHNHQENYRAVPTNSPEPHSSKFVTNDHFPNSCFILIYQRKISVGNSTPSLLQKFRISYPPFSRFLFVPFKCPQYVGAQFRGCLVINMLSDTEMNII